MRPDVLICGAGPAGCVAATVLARAGVRVQMLDRATFPRAKLCGDTVNPGVLAILHRLGLQSTVRGALPLEGMLVTANPAVRVIGRYGSGIAGGAVSRREFDDALLREALAAGAQLAERVQVRLPWLGRGRIAGVEVSTPRGACARIEAPLVIAADGGGSTLARSLRLSRRPAAPRRWAVGGYFVNVADMSPLGEMHVRPGHYIGVAPLPGSRTNACVVTADRPLIRAALRDLRGVLRADAQIGARFDRADLLAAPACLGPLAVDCSDCGVPGLLLAGDAAGFIDPMTGDGLRFALRGGELAATAALHALEDGADAHAWLRVARRREFAVKWRFNRSLRSLVASPLAIRAAAGGAVLAPGWLRHAIRYAGDVHAA